MNYIMKNQIKPQWREEDAYQDEEDESIILRLFIAICITLAIATVYALSGYIVTDGVVQ